MNSPTHSPPPPAAIERRDRFSLLLAIAIFSSLSLLASFWSQGFSEADGCTHYLYARFAFAAPYYFVNVWGRPLVTAIYSIPAVLGNRFGVRTCSLLLAIGCALVARQIARALEDRRATLAAIFTLAQPLVFLHSFSELTELPFALLLGCAFWAYTRKRWWTTAILIALSPLARPEGFGFLLLAAAALAWRRKWWALLVLPIPIIAWDIEGWILYGYPVYAGFAQRLPHALTWITWLSNNWPYADKSAYQSGSLFHFVMLMPAVVSPLIFPATCAGMWQSFRDRSFDHLAHCRRLCAEIPLLILVVHSLLYATGRMASSGELRYMLVVAPFWGVLSARGWMWLADRFGFTRDAIMIGAFASLLPIAANHYYRVVPLVYSPDWIEANAVANWLNRTRFKTNYPHLLISHPGVQYFAGVSPASDRNLEWSRAAIDHPPDGTILVWDDVYGRFNADVTRTVSQAEITAGKWIDISAFLGDSAEAPHWGLYLSPASIAGRRTSARAMPASQRSLQSLESDLPRIDEP